MYFFSLQCVLFCVCVCIYIYVISFKIRIMELISMFNYLIYYICNFCFSKVYDFKFKWKAIDNLKEKRI